MTPDDLPPEADRMVRTQLANRGIRDESVLEAMRRVPRHAFVPDADPADAYADRPLPTGEGQTISQPWIVARMTELLEVRPGHRVLEVGTGSGYQTAILAELGAEVVSIERYESLAERARDILDRIADEAEIEVVTGDGTLGWPEKAPYDRIIVTAGGPPDPPPALLEQLADGGRMVIPLGDRAQQSLVVLEKEEGEIRRIESTPCRFVPLVGKQGWQAEG